MVSSARQIGPYRVVDKIKTGSVGTVWKVANSRNHVFALKLISEKNAARPHKVKLFKKEARIGQGLDHPNIIKVHEYSHNDGRPYFSMDFFASESLKYCLRSKLDRIVKKEFYVLRQAAEALAYLHGNGIIHRDLKPENILVSEDASVRMIDLSLAQERWDGILPFSRRIEGTPMYMAPEQILKRRCDARTDIYSFGAMAFELIAKRTPFVGTTQENLFKQHVNDSPPTLRQFVRDIAPELEMMVLKCLEKDPADRWQDMTSTLYELGKWEKKGTVVRKRQVAPIDTRED